MRDHRKIRVCYVLSYYFPQYVRTKTLIEGLKQLEGVEVYEATNQNPGPWRYLETFLKLLWITVAYAPDCYVLGFRGYEIFWIVRLLTARRPLIFDHMMSPYDSLLNESKRIRKGSILEKLVYLYERSILRAADLVLTDTPIHQRYLARLFQIPPEKIHAVPVGADETLFYERVPGSDFENDCFSVFFYGSFLPLHGIDIILETANRLRAWRIRFVLVGGNRQDLTAFHRKIKRLKLTNVKHVEWINYRELPAWISRAGLCLGGPFGNTGQSQRVISGKTFQFLAMAQPTVVGEIEGDYGFVDKDNCLLVPQGDAAALSEAILWAFEHQDELARIGKRGHALYQSKFSISNISKRLRKVQVMCQST